MAQMVGSHPLRAVHVLLGTFGQMGDFWTNRGLLDNSGAFWTIWGTFGQSQCFLENAGTFGQFWGFLDNRGTFGQSKSNFFLERQSLLLT